MRIGFYARGRIDLPHPSFPRATLRIIEQAIGEAWRIIRDEPAGDFDIIAADENRITRELRSCLLDNVLDGMAVPGFTSEFFDVNRGGEFESYNGKHLQKKPDLHISIKRKAPNILRSADGLFVECKPIDTKHPAGRDYCGKGIIRFVLGEYAWAMQEGLMIGYAMKGCRLPSDLKEALDSRQKRMKHDGKVDLCPDTRGVGYGQQIYITVHRRGFTYPLGKKKAPPITLRHLWFDRN